MYDAICAAVAIDNSLVSKSLMANATVDIDGKHTRGSFLIEWTDINEDHDLFHGNTSHKPIKIALDIHHDKYFRIVRNAFKYFK